jgi:hypothetical protein
MTFEYSFTTIKRYDDKKLCSFKISFLINKFYNHFHYFDRIRLTLISEVKFILLREYFKFLFFTIIVYLLSIFYGDIKLVILGGSVLAECVSLTLLNDSVNRDGFVGD